MGLMWGLGVLLMIFNVGTSLAVMFSAHRLDARFLLLVVLTYMAFTITPFAVPYITVWHHTTTALS